MGADKAVLFLHIYKTGGTSNRELFANWAEAQGLRFAQVGSCPEGAWMSKLPDNNREYICLLPERGSTVQADGKRRINMPTPRPSQLPVVLNELDVVAGHFAWGFDQFVNKPHKYMTCLRNPTSRYVSDILYANRKSFNTSEMTLQETVDFVQQHIFSQKADRYRGIYGARLSSRMQSEVRGAEVQSEQTEQHAADMAIFHLQNNMAAVGLIEHYPVFVELVAAFLDPDRTEDKLWNSAKVYHSNKHEGLDQSDVIPVLSSEARAKLEKLLVLDWKVYAAGCIVTYHQCMEVVRNNKAAKLSSAECTSIQDTCIMADKGFRRANLLRISPSRNGF